MSHTTMQWVCSKNIFSRMLSVVCICCVIFQYTFLHTFLITHAQENSTSGLSPEVERQLQAELAKVLEEIEEQKKVLSGEQAKGSSLERDVNILTAQITQAKLKIKAKELAIASLGKDITNKTKTIQTLEQKTEQNQESLSQLIRRTQHIDSFSLAEIVLSNENLSEFFNDFDSYMSIKQSLNHTLEDIRDSKEQTETEREQLGKKQAQEIDEKISVEEEKRKIDTATAEKNKLLKISKGNQETYQSIIREREAKAAQIRNALFGLRDTGAIPFGTALEYAKAASKATGVRAAFILAILQQESDLGKNVGRCNRPEDPPERQWQAIMKPERDYEPYKRITARLGITPESKPLSCALPGGYGGAMGPSQFIPSTWESYASRIEVVTGAPVANPWDARHAIFATAIYMQDLGAGAGGYTAERTAALRYYAGGNWYKPQNQFYGDQVMAKVVNIQENMIDVIDGI